MIMPPNIQAPSLTHNLPPISADMVAADYVAQATRMHIARLPQASGLSTMLLRPFRWIGDAMLNVPPINRLSCAVGLTVGLASGMEVSRLLTGRTFNSSLAIPAEKYPSFLRPFHGLLKFDPNSNDFSDRWKRTVVRWGIYCLGGLLGVMAGTTFAYRKAYKMNRNPEHLEDYIGRTSNEQGDRWTPFVGLSAIFASASGYSMLPLPGINYGSTLAFRTTLMQDRNIMIPGLHKWLSGAPTTNYMSVRESLYDLCNYAVHNPAETPVALEYKAFNILYQLFPNAKAEHIQKFVNEVHAIRDKYYQTGGVPKDQKKAMMEEMHKHFTKQGFEDTLIRIGLNPRSIDLIRMNGLMGKIGNVLGAEKKIKALQKEMDAKLTARHPDLPPAANANEFLIPSKPHPESNVTMTKAAEPVSINSSPKWQENQSKQHESMTSRVAKPPSSFKEREDKKPDSSPALGLTA